jgi:hypothetical protein
MMLETRCEKCWAVVQVEVDSSNANDVELAETGLPVLRGVLRTHNCNPLIEVMSSITVNFLRGPEFEAEDDAG